MPNKLSDILNINPQNFLCNPFRESDNDSASVTRQINYYMELMRYWENNTC